MTQPKEADLKKMLLEIGSRELVVGDCATGAKFV